MKQLIVLYALLTLHTPTSGQDVPDCTTQKSSVVGGSLMARIPWQEKPIIIFRGKECRVTHPFEVFVTQTNGYWLLTTARDGSSVSWLSGQKSKYDKDTQTVREEKEHASSIVAQRRSTQTP